MVLAKAKTKLGPRDHGRKMSLRAFEFAEGEAGYVYELHRGHVIVSEAASYRHAMQIVALMEPLWLYRAANPGLVHAILGSMDCKLLIPEFESERHPDIAVYLTRPKGRKDRALWRTWLPELTIEVVSEGSRDRDYAEKRDEYWTLGIKEYWIVDAKLDQVVILRRGKSDWIDKTIGVEGVIETRLLPGFKIACRSIFAAARDQDETNAPA